MQSLVMAIPIWSTMSNAGDWYASELFRSLPNIVCKLQETSAAIVLGGVWQVGQLIQSRGGVVTAEQLAPFMDVTPEDLEKVDGYTNESYVVRHTLPWHSRDLTLTCSAHVLLMQGSAVSASAWCAGAGPGEV